ncbi:MAG TPA: patatin-like phospholipase family protein [Candidatus Binataceae bacterium]|nr:patatin-like phospholipase family protein [Candidatus Binataceae bacterium]
MFFRRHREAGGREATQRTIPKFLFEVLEEEYIDRHGQLPGERGWDFIGEDIKCGPRDLLFQLLGYWWTKARMPAVTAQEINALSTGDALAMALTTLNHLMQPPLLVAVRFLPPGASSRLRQLMLGPLSQPDVLLVNRLLLEELFPAALGKLDERRLKAIRRLMLARRQSALCLSGGGIRSATYSLGVVEGLARAKLLTKFDYLSTVSGGGYLGGWLAAWMHRHQRGGPGVQDELRGGPRSPLDIESPEVSHLRSYTNYLTPRVGMLSLDTWTAAAIYLRNLLLNWGVLIPLIFAILLMPRFYGRFSLLEPPDGRSWFLVWLMADSILAFLGLLYVHCCRPSIQRAAMASRRFRMQRTLEFFAGLQKRGGFWLCCMVPLLASGILLTSLLVSHLHWCWTCGDPGGLWWRFAIYGALLNIAAWLPASVILLYQPKTNWLCEFAGIALTGCVWGIGVEYASGRLMSARVAYLCWEVPLFWGAFLLAAIIFVGAASRSSDDEDREWWGRFGAALMVSVLGLSALCFVSTIGPRFVHHYPLWGKALYSLLGLSGIAAAVGANSAKTPANDQSTATWQIPANLVLSVFAILFTIALLTGLSQLGNYFVAPRPLPLGLTILGLMAFGCVASRSVTANRFSLNAMYRSRLIRAYLGASYSDRKPNPFTGFDPDDNIRMHELRPFFAECFKPALARRIRNIPQWFDLLSTETRRLINHLGDHTLQADDPQWGKISRRLADDLNAAMMADPFDVNRLSAHFPAYIDLQGLRERPLLLVNIALNLVRGQNLAWQQRKAEGFTASPLHCGNQTLGYRASRDYGADPEDGGRNYEVDEGISLGSAMSISGAAASPNMGYNSSTLLTLLMAFFNLRLGAWFGNPGPAGALTYRLSSPKSNLRPIVEEALGLTDDAHPFVYLSDGGHFENIGLYQMVLRRCHTIVVVDATEDNDYTFSDLSRAVDKTRIDLGVQITFKRLPIKKYSEDGDKSRYYVCALGEIDYKWVDGEDVENGLLIYIKPTICGDEPVDILNYRRENTPFPHETTANQWFNETQFECYRLLGLEAIRKMLRDPGDDWSVDSFDDFMRQVVSYLEPATGALSS